MRIVITGAAGYIGRLATEELAEDHELVLLDRRPVPGRESIVADLSRHRISQPLSPRTWIAGWERSFRGADAVLHLAAQLWPRATWRRALRDNIQVTWHVLAAADRHRVPKFVYASSSFAVKQLERSLAPECYAPEGPKIASDAAPRPGAAYGFSKAAGEMAGRLYVDEGRLASFLAIRLGWCAPREKAGRENSTARHMWLGPRDTKSLLRRCLEADLEGFHVVSGSSAQPESPFDLTATRELLAWEPLETIPPLESARPWSATPPDEDG